MTGRAGDDPPPSRYPGAMKIVTYNLNGIRARLPRLVEYLEEQKPDLVCLQEIKCADESFPIEDVRAAGYDGRWHGQKGFNGVAILTPEGRAATLRRTGLPGDPDDTHSRYIEAELDGVVVGSLYLPNGNPVGTEKFAYKLAWMDRLRAHALELLAEEKPAVLAGDWNVIPTDDTDDVFSARAMAHDALMQPESRAAFRTILYQGWTDAIRARSPDGAVYTFWDYTAGCWQRDAGFRIDHLLLSPQAADRLLDAGVDKEYRGREKASDHAPTWVELED
jgi:exodeoxyribonuclease-3